MVDYNRRRDCFLESLRKRGLSHAVIGNPENVKYLTGKEIMPVERFYGLFFDVLHNRCLMVVPALDNGCMKGELAEICYDDIDGAEPAVSEVLKDCRRLGAETEYFTMRRGKMFSAFCEEIQDIDEELSILRQNKDEDEVQKLRRAAEIVDESLAYIRSKLRAGMSEKEINDLLFEHVISYKGVNPDQRIVLVQIAEGSANPHGVSGERRLQKGDVILFDFCACFEGYWSDITRCMFFGAPKAAVLLEIYEIVREANEAAIKAVRPGVRACEVDEAARSVISEAGYGENFLHRTGHGLGMSVHERPFIKGGNDLILKEGMVFTIEPGIYLKGIGGIRLEDDILVTKDGAEVLTSYPKNLDENMICIDPIAKIEMSSGN